MMRDAGQNDFFYTTFLSLSVSVFLSLSCLADGRTDGARARPQYQINTQQSQIPNTNARNYKPTLFGSSSINFVGSRPKISPVAPFHSPTRIPQSLCVSIATSPTGYAMHNNVNPSFCSSSSKVKSRSVMSDWSVAPETHFATHALQERIDDNKNTSAD